MIVEFSVYASHMDSPIYTKYAKHFQRTRIFKEQQKFLFHNNPSTETVMEDTDNGKYDMCGESSLKSVIMEPWNQCDPCTVVRRRVTNEFHLISFKMGGMKTDHISYKFHTTYPCQGLSPLDVCKSSQWCNTCNYTISTSWTMTAILSWVINAMGLYNIYAWLVILLEFASSLGQGIWIYNPDAPVSVSGSIYLVKNSRIYFGSGLDLSWLQIVTNELVAHITYVNVSLSVL